MHACSVFDAEALDCFRDDALALFNCQRLERLVFEVTDCEPFVVIADPALERCVAARGGIEQLLTHLAFVDLLACETEGGHRVSASAAGDWRDEDDGVAVGKSL